jgi:hypothetical protein
MSLAVAAFLALLLSHAGLDGGPCIDPNGGHFPSYAGAVSTDAGVRIDPEG